MDPTLSTPPRPVEGLPQEPGKALPIAPVRGRPKDRRLGWAVFLVAALGMLVAVLVIDRHQWFFNDDWDFLATRTIGNLSDLFRPHYGEWSTGEVVVDRALYEVFGLHTYVPFQVVMVCLHVAIAAMLLVITLRANVRVWIATAAAVLFVLFGSGYEDILWAGGMGWVAALAFGLAQLLFSDHDGPIDRRDWLGLGMGVLGLMCSGLMLIMTVVVGLNTLIRRGWRIAIFHVAPVVVVYLIWWYSIGRRYPVSSPSILHHLGLLPPWIGNEIVASFDAMGQVPGIAAVMAVLLVVGLPMAYVGLDWSAFRRKAAPLALAVGALAFVVANGWQRATLYSGIGYERSSHFLDIFVAMVLPGIAVAGEAVVQRWRFLVPAVLAVLLIGIPGNLEKLSETSGPYSAAYEMRNERFLTSVVALPVARELPRSYQPNPVADVGVTIGWLLEQKTEGRLPQAPLLTSRQAADLSLEIALSQSDKRTTATSCQILTTAELRHLDAGQSLRFSGGELEVALVTAAGDSDRTRFLQLYGHSLVALAPLTVSVSPVSPGQAVTVCS